MHRDRDGCLCDRPASGDAGQVFKAFRVVPDYDLSIMTDDQTLFDIAVNILERIRAVIEEARPDVVLVHGDTSTTFAAALACFYLQIEASQRCRKGGGCVAVDKHYIRPGFLNDRPNALQDIHRYIEKRLIVRHNGQVIVRHHTERFEDLSSISRCWPVTQTAVSIPVHVFSSFTSGHILIASGRVPKTRRMRIIFIELYCALIEHS